MKKSLKILTIMIVGALLLFTSVSPAIATEHHDRDGKQCPHHCMSYKHKFMKTHIDMYYELLAEKYAPDQVSVWKDIRKERDELRKQLKEAKENGHLLHHDQIGEKWFEDHKELQEQFVEAVEERKAKKIKKLLPEVFKQQQDLNERYKEVLKAVKN